MMEGDRRFMTALADRIRIEMSIWRTQIYRIRLTMFRWIWRSWRGLSGWRRAGGEAEDAEEEEEGDVDGEEVVVDSEAVVEEGEEGVEEEEWSVSIVGDLDIFRETVRRGMAEGEDMKEAGLEVGEGDKNLDMADIEVMSMKD